MNRDWRARLAAALAEPPQDEHEDDGDWPIGIDGFRPAAVLIAVTDRPEPGVILTERASWLRRHAGQIAFPGGSIDPGDADPVAAALREADEELGIPPSAVEVIGSHRVYHSASGFAVTPVVGVVPPDLPFRPDPQEVADWFEVPLATLFDSGLLVARTGQWKGAERRYYELDWPDGGARRIWGVTAGIAANLARAMERAGA